MSGPTYPGLCRRLTNPSAEFIQNRVTFDGAAALAYVEEIDQFMDEPDAKEQEEKSRALWKDVQIEKENLFKDMEKFQERMKKKHPTTTVSKLNLRNCTWEQFMGEVQRAETYYKDAAITGPFGIIVKCLRSLGKNAKTFQAWIGLLPSGDYGSGICGAFTLILSTAGRMNDIRDCVYDALRDIPEAIQGARRYVSIYNDMHRPYRLTQVTAELYKAVLITLQYIMKFLMEPSGKKAVKALLSQDSYEERLVQSVEDMKRCTTNIKDEAVFCSQERQRKIDETLQQVYADSTKHHEREKAQIELLINLATRLNHLLRSSPKVDRSTGGLLETSILGAKMLEGGQSDDDVIDIPNPRDTDPTWLLEILDYDQAVPERDEATCRALGRTMSDASKDRVTYIATSEELREWLVESSQSRALLINGNSSTKATDLTSILSFLCAEISHLYRGSESATFCPLNYFCGLHANSYQDPRYSNARGMMASFIAQLLLKSQKPAPFTFDLSFIDKRMRKRLRRDDIRTLCKIFRTLVLQLSGDHVVICFIDGISIYEIADRLDETYIALESLARLVRNKKKKALFKLMVTAAGHTTYVQQHFDDEDIVVAPSYIDGARQGVVNFESIKNCLSDAEG